MIKKSWGSGTISQSSPEMFKDMMYRASTSGKIVSSRAARVEENYIRLQNGLNRS